MKFIKPVIAAALIVTAVTAQAQTKKELVQKLQVALAENFAQTVLQQPVSQLGQMAQQALQTRVPADKREAAAKAVQADITKFMQENGPIVRERAVKLAPTTIGAVLEQEFSEDELKQVIGWFESPVSKKFAQLQPEFANALFKQLVPEIGPVVEPKLKALEQSVLKDLGLPTTGAAGSAPAAKPAAPAKK